MTWDELKECLDSKELKHVKKVEKSGNEADLLHCKMRYRFKYDNMIVLKGPVGSGKTHKAKQIAETGTAFKLSLDYKNFTESFREFWDTDEADNYDFIIVDNVFKTAEVLDIIDEVNIFPKLCRVVLCSQSINIESEDCLVINLRHWDWKNFIINFT